MMIFNPSYIKTIMIYRILLSVVLLASLCCALPALEIEVSYDNGAFSVINISEVDLKYLPDHNLGEAIYETQKEYGMADSYYEFSLGSDAEVLYAFHEEYPPVIYYDYFEENGSLTGGAAELDKANTTYYLPSIPEATGFAISDAAGNEVYSVDLSQFLELEAPELPPEAPPEEIPEKPKEEPFPWILVVAILLIALVAVMFWQSKR